MRTGTTEFRLSVIKDRRNEYGISQNKLATACGLSRPLFKSDRKRWRNCLYKTMRKIFNQLESFNPDLPFIVTV